jgi:proline dehydrogenase
VDANYVKLAQVFLNADNNGSRPYPEFATHDEKIINWVNEYTTQNKIGRNRFEFQMLYGIRSDLQRKLVADGYKMRVYVPYGTHWYPYFMRRLAERPANVIFLMSNLFK